MMSIGKLAIATGLAVASASPTAADVTLINVFEVPENQVETVITAWQKARDFLSDEPGYIETALHRSLQADARFQLINIARWQSAEQFFAATAKMRAAGVFPRIDGLGVNPALYSVVRTDPDPEEEEKR